MCFQTHMPSYVFVFKRFDCCTKVLEQRDPNLEVPPGLPKPHLFAPGIPCTLRKQLDLQPVPPKYICEGKQLA